MFSLASHFTQNEVSTRNPRHSLSIDIEFQRFKTPLCNHQSPKPGHIPADHTSLLSDKHAIWPG